MFLTFSNHFFLSRWFIDNGIVDDDIDDGIDTSDIDDGIVLMIVIVFIVLHFRFLSKSSRYKLWVVIGVDLDNDCDLQCWWW